MESVEFSFARQHQGGFVDDENDDVAWAVEKGSFFGGEEFLVDDLLDLGELETEGDEEHEEKEVENQDDEEEEKQEEGGEEEKAVAMREENKSCCSSALTFAAPFPFPPPVSDFTLPAQDDVAALEWVSRVVDDSFSEVLTCETHHQLQPQAMDQAPPPPLPPAVPVKARRSKRARPLSGSSWSSSSYSSWDEGRPLVCLDSSASSSTTTAAAASSATSSSSSYSFSSSQVIFAHQLLDEIPLHPLPPPKSLVLDNKKPKKRGRKPKAASYHGITATAAANNGGGGERRCSHCGVNKTPQWRTGPMGAKTLCNACGVRYKSGRLLPEYRPACSPTFISHVHSNSHSKVLEMRRKEAEKMEKRQQHRQNLLLISSATPVASF